MGTPVNQENERLPRRMLALGALLAVVGILCVGGGLALLIWRVVQPETAIILPPGFGGTREPTPTPGVLSSLLLPPALPDDVAEIVILPVSEGVTPVPVRPTRLPSLTPTSSQTPLSPAQATPTAPVAPILTHTPIPPPEPSAVPAVPDRILIDAIGIDAPVVPVGQKPLTLDGQLYSQWEVPNRRAAGWHQSSAPLGQTGNTVLNGHHNVYGEVFHYLVALQPGDIITLESSGQRYYYLVAQTMTLAEEGQPVEVRQANARWILPTADERVTLITCWPLDASSHRLIVIALPLAALGDTVEVP